MITEELKDIKLRILDVEKRELLRGENGVGEEMVKKLAIDVAKETLDNQMRVVKETVDHQMRREVETKFSDHMQNLVSENKVELAAFAQEIVNEKLNEEMAKVRSFETKEKAMMKRIQRMEEEMTSEKTSSEVTEALLEDWASEEVFTCLH